MAKHYGTHGNAWDATATGPAKAELDIGALGGGCDTVVEATAIGVAGNAYSVRLIGDSAPAAGVSIVVAAGLVTIHYESDVSTVTLVEAAIAALTGADDIVGVKTGGTGATVLTAPTDNVAATALAGGLDATSAAFNAHEASVVGAFGHVAGATTLTLQASADGSNWYDTGQATTKGGAADFDIPATSGAAAPWVRLKSSANVIATATLAGKG